MRQLIEQRLAVYEPVSDPVKQTLADVVGPVPESLLPRLHNSRPAAVLLGLIERDGALNVIFTQRARHLSVHAGQVSFPGGRLEASDAGLIEAALREASEEIGLASELVAVAGRLDSFVTVTGFHVTPFVGFVDSSFAAEPDEAEVESVFEVPFEFFLDAGNISEGYRDRMGVRFRVYEFRYGQRHIWGATAAMLVNLKNVLSI